MDHKSKIWISSDHHFGHENIIRYAKRPFKSVEEMNETLIQRHNSVVRPEDHWYCLGDVTMLRGGKVQQRQMAAWIQRMNGHKRLILGNHDHFPVEAYLAAGFEKVKGTGRWLDGYWLSHFPIHPQSMGNAKGCIHGHIHNAPAYAPVEHFEGHQRRYINVSVEAIDYTPVALEAL